MFLLKAELVNIPTFVFLQAGDVLEFLQPGKIGVV